MRTYKVSEATQKRLHNNFDFHPAVSDQAQRYEALRAKAKELAWEMATLCPDTRELSIALTSVEDSVMWASAAIARNEKPEAREGGPS